MAAPILNLDSLVDRPTVVINDKEYWLLTLDILPPLDAHRLQFMTQRVAELLGQATPLSEDEERELKTLPDRMCRMVLDAPDDVHQALTDPKRMLIAETAATTFRSGLRIPPLAGPTAAAASSTGESGSPA
jgi:hypothetical protein